MDSGNVVMLTVLLEKMCVMMVIAYLLTGTRYFKELLEGKFTLENQAVLIIFFGAVSIYGTYSGIPILDTEANIRDIGPMVAGLAGGPVIGLGAGLIGGIHRYSMGGFTMASCSLSTVLAGLLGGVIYVLNKKKLVYVPAAIVFAVLIEAMHMGLTLLIAKPFDEAVLLVSQVSLPMILANAMGVAVFVFIVSNILRERKTARERDEYRQEIEREKAELNIASDIQKSFLPETVPSLKGYDIAAVSIPAKEVGGDFYDFITLSGDKIGFIIADVSGKSVPAALFMALSRAVVRANAIWSPGARDVIREANNLITRDSRSGMFVTLFYSVLDVSSRKLTYVNAGHNPPLMFNSITGDFKLLRAKGIALGALEDMDYEEITMPLESGCTIVFYTDGVTEATNDTGEQFGEERLQALIKEISHLPAREMVEKIEGQVNLFCYGSPQFDDITLMVLKVLPE